jgi:hypothetical protein
MSQMSPFQTNQWDGTVIVPFACLCAQGRYYP